MAARSDSRRHLHAALDVIYREAPANPDDGQVRQALAYLVASVPPDTPVRAALLRVRDNLDFYRAGMYVQSAGFDSFMRVSEALVALGREIDEADEATLPAITAITSRAQLRAVREQLGVSEDWLDADEQDVDATTTETTGGHAAVVTGGVFGGLPGDIRSPTVYKTVVFYQGLVPRAQVPLATLLEWAEHSDQGEPRA